MSKFTCIVLCVLAGTISNLHVANGESLSESLKPVIETCSKEHGVSDAAIQAARAAGSTDGIEPCFIHCVFEKLGILNKQGQYDLDTGLTNLKKFMNDNVQYKNLEDVFTKCSTVKDKAVSNGCERAVFLARCLLEHKTSILI